MMKSIFSRLLKFSKKFIAGESHGQNITLQDAATEIGLIPKLIKMDIGGAEYDVILSSLSFLKKTKPVISSDFQEHIVTRASLKKYCIHGRGFIGYLDANLEYHDVASANFLIKYTYGY